MLFLALLTVDLVSEQFSLLVLLIGIEIM